MTRLAEGQTDSEAGVALLIAIFVLMLVSVVAMSLLLSSGTETALDANYRSSATVYYAAVAGLEEARGRLLPKNPNYLNTANPQCVPQLGVQMLLGRACYITNPVGAEDVLATYPDLEYTSEFGGAPGTVETTASVSNNNTANLPGPLFKWVRINAVTEQSLNLDVDGDGLQAYPLYYDPSSSPKSGLLSVPNPQQSNPNAVQVLEITSLAVLPNGSQKILQYVVFPFMLTPDLPIGTGVSDQSFPAALTLAGNGVTFAGAAPSFAISGNESTAPPPPPPGPPPGCTAYNPQHPAIGYTNSSDGSGIAGAATPAASYPGGPTGPPAIQNVTAVTAPYKLSSDWQSPTALESIVQSVTQSADWVVKGPATQGDLPTALMSASNPMVIVVNGDLRLNSWGGTGYGTLLVTGTFTYDPTASWNGIILVIGQGKIVSTTSGLGQFNGAVFLAQTRDASGNLLPGLGAASFSQTGGGTGIYYDSCYVSVPMPTLGYSVQGPLIYKVLSFREISQ